MGNSAPFFKNIMTKMNDSLMVSIMYTILLFFPFSTVHAAPVIANDAFSAAGYVRCANSLFAPVKCPPGLEFIPPEVIFSENFDDQPDFFPSISSTVCKENGLTGTCDDDVPDGWDYYRNADDTLRPETDPQFKAGFRISGDIKRGPTGKSWIKTSESNHPPEENNYFSDAILTKNLGQDYDEIYLSAWVFLQDDWQWQSEPQGGRQLKMFRIGHVDSPLGSNDPFALGAGGFSGPLYIFDLQQSQFGFTALHSPRCDPQESVYLNCGQNTNRSEWETFSYFDCLEGAPCNGWIFSGDGLQHPSFEDLFAPARWNKIEIHVKMNSAINVGDGVLEFWFNDHLEHSATDIPWKQTGSTNELGWNFISIGGNWNNWYTPVANQGEQFYAVDDIQVCTERCP